MAELLPRRRLQVFGERAGAIRSGRTLGSGLQWKMNRRVGFRGFGTRCLVKLAQLERDEYRGNIHGEGMVSSLSSGKRIR